MREAGPRPLCDQRKRLNFDLHISLIARPRYPTKNGFLWGPFFRTAIHLAYPSTN